MPESRGWQIAGAASESCPLHLTPRAGASSGECCGVALAGTEWVWLGQVSQAWVPGPAFQTLLRARLRFA